ncbi:leucine-rich repeat extensin-like protein 3 [Zingiber officinale]|uniref:leucine-rich repeat extensin-like protein 3 n=1 Tax=Zingiber officinale TaxID=94328 RepID=UPI001C4BA1D5|nr:leucine-rich repeat extensin-like protein 3 [Zingiber officinale]
MPRRGAGRSCKRALESLTTESPERSAGIEPVGQGQTPHGTAGVSCSRILTIPSPELSTPTVFTVPPAVPPSTYPAPPPAVPAAAYPAPPPPVPTTCYSAPPPPLPSTAYPAPPSPVSATAYPTPAPAVFLSGTTTYRTSSHSAYIDPIVPPAVPAPAYAVTPGVPSSAYPAVPLVVPAPVVPSVPAAIPTHLTDMIAARARIPTLVESVKS